MRISDWSSDVCSSDLFYRAVQDVFRSEWKGHTPKTSRLVHGAGIVALGYVMEVLALLDGARRWEDFAKGLGCLAGRTDRKSVVSGKSVSVRVDLGGRRIIKKKTCRNQHRRPHR